jgi:hypothetical protein
MSANTKMLTVVTIAKDNFSGLVDTGISISHLDVEWIVVSCDTAVNLASLNALGLFPSQVIRDGGTGIYPAFNMSIPEITGDYVWFLNAGDISLLSKIGDLGIERAKGKTIVARQFNLETKSVSKLSKNPKNWIRFAIRPVPHQAIFFPRISLFKKQYRTDIGIAADQCFIYEILKETGCASLDLIVTLFEGFGRGSKTSDFADNVNYFLNSDGFRIRYVLKRIRAIKAKLRA